mmetsp:Transcript_6285/g.16378  ORF Transcript_6285/g.16378 Transcript_6285/m.16378 type:complete len:153 (+) Transcript_6285:115-573(+)
MADSALSLVEVSEHNTMDDCWLILGNAKTGGPKVYDVSTYLNTHPGGAYVILQVAGTYADAVFEDFGHSTEAYELLADYLVGPLEAASDVELAAISPPQTAADGGTVDTVVLVALVAVGVVLSWVFRSPRRRPSFRSLASSVRRLRDATSLP